MFRFQLIEEPVVQRPVIFELQRAQRMRNALVGIRQSVGEIVHRVDAPLVARMLMGNVTNAVQRRIAQIHIGRCHVDLRAQHMLAVGELAATHAAEQVEVLLDTAIAIRAVLARLRQCAAVLANLLGAQAVHIGTPISIKRTRTRAGARSSRTHASAGPPSRSPASARLA